MSLHTHLGRGFVLLLLSLITIAETAYAQTFLSGYSFRNRITIQGTQVPAAQTSFPVLVLINGSDFVDNLEGNVTSASGFDIVFTTDNGTTLLNHELVTYDETSNVFQAWVEVDLTASDQDIFVYYGNSAVITDQSAPATWGNGFEAVWHFEEDLSGTSVVANSTAAGTTLDGTASAGNNLTTVTGQVGNGFSFPGGGGTNNFIEVLDVVNSTNSALDLNGTTISVSAWVNPGDQDQDSQFSVIEKSRGTGAGDTPYWLGIEQNGAANNHRLQTRINTSGGNFNIEDGDDNPDLSTAGTLSGWYHLFLVYDGTNLVGYANGAQEISTGVTGTIDEDDTDQLFIGRRGGGDGRRYVGLLDEIRVSSAVRDANWVLTEFNNQSNPSTFFSIATRESVVDITTSVTASFITSGSQVIFTASGTDIDGNATLQWQQSTDNSNFTDVVDGVDMAAGATTTSFTSPTLTDDTYFRVVVQNAGAADITFNSSSTLISVVPAFAFPDYSTRRQITINEDFVLGEDNVPAETSHSNFPVLVSLTDDDFRSVGNGGSVTSESGFDIIFTDTDGATLLNHEQESYDPATGTIVYWVQIPSLPTDTDYEFFVYYGNGAVTASTSSTTTWSENFSGVWHMNEDPSTSRISDASGNDNEAVPVALESDDLVTGKISGGLDLDGFNADGGNVGEFLFVGAEDLVPSSLNITGQVITVSGWMNPSDLSDGSQFSIIEKANNNQDVDISYWLGRDGNDGQARLGTPNTTNNGLRLNSPALFTTDTWFYVAMTYDANAGADNFVLYVNGQSQNTDTRTGDIITDPLDEFFIGGRDDNTNRFFEGIIDELRVAETARSAGWIATEYQNQCFVSTFETLDNAQGCPDPVVGGTATATDPAVFIGESTSIVLSGQTAGATIQWQQSTNGVDFTDISGQTSTLLNVSNILQSTFYRASLDNGTCSAFSTVASVQATATILEGFSFRKCVEIDASQVIDDGGGDNALLNFPFLIDIRNDPDLSPDNVDRNGEFALNNVPFPLDIVFSDASGNLLTFEVEEFSFNGTASGNLRAWVQVPSLSSQTSTKIFLNYGNCNVVAGASTSTTDNGNSIVNSSNSNTWSNGFVGVWHLEDETSIADATSNVLNGTIEGGTLTGSNGQIGQGLSLAGGDNSAFVRIAANAPADNTAPSSVENFSNYTLSSWVNATANNVDRSVIELSDGTNTDGGDIKYFLGLDDGDVQVRASVGTATADQSINDNVSVPLQDVNDGNWHYLTSVYDGAEIRTFIDGNFVGVSDNTNLNGGINMEANDELRFGANNNVNRFNGEVDEIRISNAVRGDGWIQTEYNNQNNPVIDFGTPGSNTSFYSLGDEESFILWTDDDMANSNWSSPDNWGICRLPLLDETVRLADPTDIAGNNPVFDLTDDQIGGLIIETNADLSFGVATNTLTLTGDLTNNSGGTFAPPGTITFGGSVAQNIQGNDGSTFGTLVVDNLAGVNIDAFTTVTTDLNFMNGSVTLTDDNLSLQGTITGAGASNFIITPFDNCLIRQDVGGGLAGDILFPLGASAGSYTPTVINNDAGVADDFCVYVSEGFFPVGLCGALASDDNNVIDRTWFIEESVAGGSNVNLSLQWNSTNEVGDFGMNRSNVFFAHLEATNCENVGSATLTDNDPIFSASVSGLTSFSPYSVATDESVLPVEFLGFTGVSAESGVLLEWSTATELNNEQFLIERAGEDLEFSEIGAVPGAGNSNRVVEYEFLDRSAFPGVWFYRIRQVDFDGQFAFSRIIRVVIDAGENRLSIFPNPNDGSFVVRGSDFTPDSSSEIRILDINGRVIQRKLLTVERGEFFEERFALNLKPGIYIINVKNLSEVVTKRIVVGE